MTNQYSRLKNNEPAILYIWNVRYIKFNPNRSLGRTQVVL